jgi:uncharacterized protein (TIGR00255 family)
MKSMTGYAKRQFNIDQRNFLVEIKSLNGKQIDASVKLPADVKEHEMDIRAMLNTLDRGKIDFSLSEELWTATAPSLNDLLANERFRQVSEFTQRNGCSFKPDELMMLVLQQPDVWASATVETVSDELWQQIKEQIAITINELDATRQHEGSILEKDILLHIDAIEQLSLQIPQYEAERITTAKERMRSYLADAAIKEVDQNRFEQELIYYLEKLDITEEKVRLAKHINYFRDVAASEPTCGKKLAFIAQEMGREINTTGSKANHVEIQRLVVAMKDELEKIKEQLGNIL